MHTADHTQLAAIIIAIGAFEVLYSVVQSQKYVKYAHTKTKNSETRMRAWNLDGFLPREGVINDHDVVVMMALANLH